MKHAIGHIVREKNIAIVCLTIMAIVAMVKVPDPENIIVNIVICIGSFAAGVAAGKRKTDGK